MTNTSFFFAVNSIVNSIGTTFVVDESSTFIYGCSVVVHWGVKRQIVDTITIVNRLRKLVRREIQNHSTFRWKWWKKNWRKKRTKTESTYCWCELAAYAWPNSLAVCRAISLRDSQRFKLKIPYWKKKKLCCRCCNNIWFSQWSQWMEKWQPHEPGNRLMLDFIWNGFSLYTAFKYKEEEEPKQNHLYFGFENTNSIKRFHPFHIFCLQCSHFATSLRLQLCFFFSPYISLFIDFCFTIHTKFANMQPNIKFVHTTRILICL